MSSLKVELKLGGIVIDEWRLDEWSYDLDSYSHPTWSEHPLWRSLRHAIQRAQDRTKWIYGKE